MENAKAKTDFVGKASWAVLGALLSQFIQLKSIV